MVPIRRLLFGIAWVPLSAISSDFLLGADQTAAAPPLSCIKIDRMVTYHSNNTRDVAFGS